MASSCTHFCTLCQEDYISSLAISWCLECEEWLCSDCEKHHVRSKASKQHKTITLAAYETLPPHVLKISNRCTEHHLKCDRFCLFHGAPCCLQCSREAHKVCELSPLIDVLQNVKESAAVCHLERDLNEILQNFEVVERHVLERITKVHEQKRHCLNEIKRVRTSANEHLDTIERNILDELSQKEKDIKKTMESLASQIKSKKRRVDDLRDSLLKTKQYATDLQIFLSIKEMEKQTSEDGKYLDDLKKGDIIADKSLEFEVSPALESLQMNIVAFGRISMNSVPSKLKLKRTSQGAAQLPLPVVSTLDKISLVKTLTIKLSHAQDVMITACAILRTGECIFADYENNRLLLYDSRGTYVRDVVKTSGLLPDMCYIENGIVGVSFPSKHKVRFIDLFKNKIVKTFKMGSDCYGIDCYSGKLFVTLPEKGTVVLMGLDGKIEQRVHIPGEHVNRIAFCRNRIFCTDRTENGISCYDMNGKMIWKHTYEGLIAPHCITIDKISDIIYVAGRVSNTLLAISFDGNQSKIVLSEEDGLKDVKSVYVSSDNKLLVCNSLNGLAFVYQL